MTRFFGTGWGSHVYYSSIVDEVESADGFKGRRSTCLQKHCRGLDHEIRLDCNVKCQVMMMMNY